MGRPGQGGTCTPTARGFRLLLSSNTRPPGTAGHDYPFTPLEGARCRRLDRQEYINLQTVIKIVSVLQQRCILHGHWPPAALFITSIFTK